MPQKIRPCLWFDGQALQAAKFYTSIFENSKITAVSKYGEGMPGKKGSVMAVEFTLGGVAHQALNGGPEFKFSEAISLSVRCKTQQEIDTLWRKLTSGGGEPGPCGWLKDKYGLSWQIVPEALETLMKTKSQAKQNAVMGALLKMGKLEIAALKKAAASV